MKFNLPVTSRLTISAFWAGIGLLMLIGGSGADDIKLYFAALVCFASAGAHADAAYLAHVLCKLRALT